MALGQGDRLCHPRERAQQFPLSEKMFLADEFIERARPHARRQRLSPAQVLLVSVAKQIHQRAPWPSVVRVVIIDKDDAMTIRIHTRFPQSHMPRLTLIF